MKLIHPAAGEAAFHRGCSVWSTVISGGSSCHSDRGGGETGCWVWKVTSQREENLEGLVHFTHSFIHDILIEVITPKIFIKIIYSIYIYKYICAYINSGSAMNLTSKHEGFVSNFISLISALLFIFFTP